MCTSIYVIVFLKKNILQKYSFDPSTLDDKLEMIKTIENNWKIKTVNAEHTHTHTHTIYILYEALNIVLEKKQSARFPLFFK